MFEEKWLLDETHGVSPSEKLHLLNTVLHLSPKSGGLTSKHNGIEISVDDSATLCGEKANSNAGKAICLSLPTFLSPEHMGEGAMKMLRRVSLIHDISNLEVMLLPWVIESNHWGLIVFDLLSQRILNDDGFHMKPPSVYFKSCVKVLCCLTLVENSHRERFSVDKWESISIESFGMARPTPPWHRIGKLWCWHSPRNKRLLPRCQGIWLNLPKSPSIQKAVYAGHHV